MSQTDIDNHSLVNEFPESRDVIHRLKVENTRFAKLATEYHDLDHKVRGLETRSVPTSDENFENMKKRRLHLKDELYRMISDSK